MGWVIVIDGDDVPKKNVNCATLTGLKEFYDFTNAHRHSAPDLAQCIDILFANSEYFPSITEDIHRLRPQANADLRPIMNNLLRAMKKAKYYIDITQ